MIWTTVRIVLTFIQCHILELILKINLTFMLKSSDNVSVYEPKMLQQKKIIRKRKQCKETKECAPSFTCTGGACVLDGRKMKPCREDANCPNWYKCAQDPASDSGHCWPAGCQADYDCPFAKCKFLKKGDPFGVCE